MRPGPACRVRIRPAWGLAAAVLASFAGPLPASDLRVESSLEPRVIGPDGHARLTIEVQGPGYQQPRLQPRFELENLEVVGRPDQTHGMSLGVDGESWRYSWTWTLRPLEVGRAGVVDVRILVGDRELELPPRHLEVTRTPPPDASPPPADRRSRLRDLLERHGRGGSDDRDDDRDDDGDAGPELFLRAEAVPERPYVGQRVLYTVYLYTRVSVRAMEARSLPAFQGVWARSLESDAPEKERVTWEGEPYTRVALLRKELYPMAARNVVLDPVRARFVVERIDRGRFSFAPVRVPAELERESNPVTLEVRPLPAEGAPGEGAGPFTGPVGSLELRARLDPEHPAVDRGATLTVVASGDGYLEALSPPPLVLPEGVEDLEVLGPETAPPPESPGNRASRCWRFLLVPRRAGSWELPALELPYFDPSSGEYRTARAEMPELVARERPAGTSDGGGSGTVRSAGGPESEPWARVRKVLPWAVAVPCLAVLAVVLRRRSGAGRCPSGAVDTMDRRLDGALQEGRPRRAAGEIEAAWREFLAEELAVPDALPPARWPDELRDRGAPREAVSELRDLLEDVHFLRFAPELSAAGALAREIAGRSRRVARVLARTPGRLLS